MKRTLILLPLLLTIAQSQTLNQRLNGVFNQFGDARSPGFAVLIRHHGRTIFERERGVTDLRTRTLLSAQTDFRLASCTKQFTAMSIMLLVHDGKLRYDDTLTKIFPDFPAYGRNITIRNLLNHSGGLPDYEDLMDAPAYKGKWTPAHQITDEEVLDLLEHAGVGTNGGGKFAPGTQWSYSNSGYVMLGLVVAKVSGMTFPDFLQARIFAPLKMSHTLAFVRGKNEVPNRSYGHSLAPENQADASAESGSGGASANIPPQKFVETDQSSTSATLGDGGVYSNLEDLAKWDEALAHHTLLSAEEMRPALTPFKLPAQNGAGAKAKGELPKWTGDSGDSDPQAGRPVAYGFGWFLDPYIDAARKSHPRMWHYGDTVGFKSAIVRFTADGVSIIVLCNRSDVNQAALATKFADVIFATHPGTESLTRD